MTLNNDNPKSLRESDQYSLATAVESCASRPPDTFGPPPVGSTGDVMRNVRKGGFHRNEPGGHAEVDGRRVGPGASTGAQVRRVGAQVGAQVPQKLRHRLENCVGGAQVILRSRRGSGKCAKVGMDCCH